MYGHKRWKGGILYAKDGKVGYYMRKMERWDMRKRRDSAVALTPLLRQLKPHLPDLPADSAQGLAGALITGMVHTHTHLSTRSARSTHLHSFPCSGRRRRGKSELLQEVTFLHGLSHVGPIGDPYGRTGPTNLWHKFGGATHTCVRSRTQNKTKGAP